MLVIITTHPIQYQVPLWQAMAKDLSLKFEVWFLTDFGTKESYDVEFGKTFAWDIPTLEGYPYRFLKVNKDAAPNTGFRNLRLKENLSHRFKANGVSHVYINGWQVVAYWQALFQAKAMGLKTFLKAESNDLKKENIWKWPLKKYLLSYFFKKIDYFLYIGSANKRLYLKYGIPEHKLLPAYYCVDNERFAQQSALLSSQREEIRKTWQIPVDAYCILFAGKFISKKRPLDLIKAVSLLNPQIPIHLLFVGSGELKASILNATSCFYDESKKTSLFIKDSEKPKSSIVGFLNQKEIAKAYLVADCLVLPSDTGETWGLVVNEAMACGLPCIVSDACGSAEDLALPLANYLVYPCGDTLVLKESIKKLMESPISVQKVKQQVSSYNYQVTIQSVKNIMQGL